MGQPDQMKQVVVILLLCFYCSFTVPKLFCFQAIETCVGTAGFSVGEFAALVFAEVMSFADGRCFLFETHTHTYNCFYDFYFKVKKIFRIL